MLFVLFFDLSCRLRRLSLRFTLFFWGFFLRFWLRIFFYFWILFLSFRLSLRLRFLSSRNLTFSNGLILLLFLFLSQFRRKYSSLPRIFVFSFKIIIVVIGVLRIVMFFSSILKPVRVLGIVVVIYKFG